MISVNLHDLREGILDLFYHFVFYSMEFRIFVPEECLANKSGDLFLLYYLTCSNWLLRKRWASAFPEGILRKWIHKDWHEFQMDLLITFSVPIIVRPPANKLENHCSDKSGNSFYKLHI